MITSALTLEEESSVLSKCLLSPQKNHLCAWENHQLASLGEAWTLKNLDLWSMNLIASHILPISYGKILHKSFISISDNSLEPSWWGINTAASHLDNFCGQYLWLKFEEQMKNFLRVKKKKAAFPRTITASRRKKGVTTDLFRKEKVRVVFSHTFSTAKAKEHHPGPEVSFCCQRTAKGPSQSTRMIIIYQFLFFRLSDAWCPKASYSLARKALLPEAYHLAFVPWFLPSPVPPLPPKCFQCW